VSTANADAGEIALLKEDLANVRRMLADLADGPPNRAPSRGPPPAASGPSVGPPPARGSEYRGYRSEMENDTPAQETIALEREYARAAAFEKIMQRAGFVDEHVHAPRCHEMVLQAREAAPRLAVCRLTQRPGKMMTTLTLRRIQVWEQLLSCRLGFLRVPQSLSLPAQSSLRRAGRSGC
jgi:hypothetical protein